jgi:hypothetical protein
MLICNCDWKPCIGSNVDVEYVKLGTDLISIGSCCSDDGGLNVKLTDVDERGWLPHMPKCEHREAGTGSTLHRTATCQSTQTQHQLYKAGLLAGLNEYNN